MTEAKKRFIATARYADQVRLLMPEPLPPPPDRALPTAPKIVWGRPLQPVQRGPPVHALIANPETHPAYSTFVERGLAAGLAAWHAAMCFRLALMAMHGREVEARAQALSALALELDALLVADAPLALGPLGPPSVEPASPIPGLPAGRLFDRLAFPEAAPERVMSLHAALASAAVAHAHSLAVYAPESPVPPPPLDLAMAFARATQRPLSVTPIPSWGQPVSDEPAELLASGVFHLEARGAALLGATDPEAAIRELPTVLARMPVPAARLAVFRAYALALRAVHGLPEPGPDEPGVLAQLQARLLSPLRAVVMATLEELAQLRGSLALGLDPRRLGLDLPSRFPGALAEARSRLDQGREVPRWVLANIAGADRNLLAATLIGRLPVRGPMLEPLLLALCELHPTALEPALRELVRESWVASEVKLAARKTLARLGLSAP